MRPPWEAVGSFSWSMWCWNGRSRMYLTQMINPPCFLLAELLHHSHENVCYREISWPKRGFSKQLHVWRHSESSAASFCSGPLPIVHTSRSFSPPLAMLVCLTPLILTNTKRSLKVSCWRYIDCCNLHPNSREKLVGKAVASSGEDLIAVHAKRITIPTTAAGYSKPNVASMDILQTCLTICLLFQPYMDTVIQ